MTPPRSINQIVADLEFRIRRTEQALLELEAEIVHLRSKLPGNVRHVPSGVPRNTVDSDSTRLGIPGNHDRPGRRSHLRIVSGLSRAVKEACTTQTPNLR
jgi:hypothetical protein